MAAARRGRRAQCAWVAAGIDCTVNAGASYLTAAGWQPIDLATATIYAAVKWTGTQVLSGYAPILSDNYNNQNLYLDGARQQRAVSAHAVRALFQEAYGLNLNDGNWHILVGEYDGANIYLFLDGLEVAAYNVGAHAPVQIAQLFLGNFGNAAFWPGQMGYVALYSVAHSTAQVAANTTAIQLRLWRRAGWRFRRSRSSWFSRATRSPTRPVAWRPQSKYYHVAQAAISPFPQGANDAVSGSCDRGPGVPRGDCGWMVRGSERAKGAVRIHRGQRYGRRGEHVCGGPEEPTAWRGKRRAPGLKIVLATLLPQTTAGFNAFRDAVNR